MISSGFSFLLFFPVSCRISSAVGLSSGWVESILPSKLIRWDEYLEWSHCKVGEVKAAASSVDLIQVLPWVRRKTIREPSRKISAAVLGG